MEKPKNLARVDRAAVLPVDATVLMIFLSCFGIPGASLSPLFMGILGDRYGLKASFIVAPVFLLLLVVIMILEARIKDTAQQKELTLV
jgi:fucose permease